jgi:hypothetical protein
MNRQSCATLAVILVAAVAWNAKSLTAASAYVPFTGEKTTWHDGFDRYDFVMDDATLEITPITAPTNEVTSFGIDRTLRDGKRRCVVVVPKQAAPGYPWSWRGCYWNHQPQAEVELLRRGFHIAYVSPDARGQGKAWDAWYRFLTEQHGLSKKPAFIGMSKGGVNEYSWTVVNPDKVSCIFGENPILRTLTMSRTPPLDNLAPLAKAGVPLIHDCGSLDPWLNDQTRVAERRYKELGGEIEVIVKNGVGHFPTEPADPKPIVDFILKSQEGAR